MPTGYTAPSKHYWPILQPGRRVRMIRSLDGYYHEGHVLDRGRPQGYDGGERDWYLLRTCCGEGWFLREGLVKA